MLSRVFPILLCLVFSPLQNTNAAIELPAVIGNHAVLQMDMKVPIWGKAAPGTEITVTFADQTVTSITDESGNWRADLAPLEASAEGRKMIIAGGGERIVLKDILVGVVWLCGGQSNMEWSVRESMNPKEEMAAGDLPWLRCINAPRRLTATPEFTVDARWKVSTPKTCGDFTAVGTYMARRIHEELGVPVGLLDVNYGGTRIEAWIDLESFAAHPRFRGRIREELFGANSTKGEMSPEMPEVQLSDPAVLFNGMTAAFVPYAIQGAIWYQGEANDSQEEAEEYKELLPLLIHSWRNQWDSDFAFGIVQLAAYLAVSDDPVQGGWAYIRNAQDFAHRIVSNTGMAVLTDIGDARDIHPLNKQDVGRRLADWALNRCHGRSDLPESGPFYLRSKVDGNAMILEFTHCGDGVVGRRGKPIDGFAIQGQDGRWHWGVAEVSGPTEIRVTHPQVQTPNAVRYAWQDNPVRANVVSSFGLPMAPFKTD